MLESAEALVQGECPVAAGKPSKLIDVKRNLLL